MTADQIYTINYNFNPDTIVWFVYDYSVFKGKIVEVDLEIFNLANKILTNKVYYWINTSIYGEYKVDQLYTFATEEEANNYLNNYINLTVTPTATVSLTQLFTQTPSATVSISLTKPLTPTVTPTYSLTPSITV
jgi:hypothetical protein